MTLEEEIRRGLHGNHCKVIEDMLVETVRDARERTTYRIALNLIQDGKMSLDKIADVLDIPIEIVQELNRWKEFDMQEQEIVRQLEELENKLDEIHQKGT